jgi:hypothetical protein
MTNSDHEDVTLTIRVDAATFASLQEAAGERGQGADELVTRWVRERLAHEAERKLGRARTQRPIE